MLYAVKIYDKETVGLYIVRADKPEKAVSTVRSEHNISEKAWHVVYLIDSITNEGILFFQIAKTN